MTRLKLIGLLSVVVWLGTGLGSASWATVAWTQQFGTSGSDDARSVAVDASGTIVVAGGTSGALGGTTAGLNDAFVRKYAADGNTVLWTQQFGSSTYDYAKSVAVDASGNVVVVGYTYGALVGTNAGLTDAFVRKYAMSATTTAITSIGPAYVGYPYTVTWSVTSGTAGTLTGTVSVRDGNGASCSATVATGSCDLTSTTAGATTLTATYSGDGEYAGSQTSVAVTVNSAVGGLPTTTTIGTISPEPSQVNQTYAVAYSVTSVIGTPDGTVTVSDGSNVTGSSCTATVAAGTCSITSTTSGSKTITATYGGSATYATSTNTKSHQVNEIPKSASTTTITAITPASVVEGTPYTVSYSVSPSNATGPVTVDDGTGATCSGSAPTGSCALTSTTAGTKTITASYGGDSLYNTSSGTAPYVVSPSVTIPNAPSIINAVVTSTTIPKGKKTQTVYSGTISWTDNSANETGFTLQRYKKNPRGICQVEATWTATVGPNTTTYNDQNAQSATCGYGVAAYNSAGTSSYANDLDVTH